MYHHVRGELLELTPATAVVEAGGVGFDIRIPLSTFERLKGKSSVSLFTHLHVREDDHRLFGFATKAERELFRLLLSVSGVGPTIAIQALSALSPAEVASAISREDLKTLQKMKGVGKKLAERLVLELRDRVCALLEVLGAGAVSAQPSSRGGASPRDPGLDEPAVADAILALVSLGFDSRGAEARVLEKRRQLASEGRALNAETLVKECLRSG